MPKPIKAHLRNAALPLCLAFGLLMRIGIVISLPEIGGDGSLYEQLGWNIAQHGTYSAQTVMPYTESLARSPGYPLFIAGVFLVAGRSHTAVRVIQALVDWLMVIVVYVTARRLDVAPPILVACIAAVLPFTAIYARYLLSETIAIFMTAVMLLILVRARDEFNSTQVLYVGLCLGVLVLIRPDFVLLPVAIVVYFAILAPENRRIVTVAVLSVGVCLPLAPWVARNLIAFGTFQPLATVGGFDGVQPTGFLAWVRTWHTDLRERDRGVWPYWTREWDRFEFPPVAFENDEERARVSTLLERARAAGAASQPAVAELIAIEHKFASLASERSNRHPFRTWVGFPILRAVRLWINSRIEAFPLPAVSGIQGRAISFSVALAIMLTTLNITFVAASVAGGWFLRNQFVALIPFLMLIVYRTAFHALWAGMETRYVLEAFPALYIFAAAGIVTIARLLRTHLLPQAAMV